MFTAKALSFVAYVTAKACKDEKQWASCLQAYINKECLDGCDRTCGKCSTDICYDMIPQSHAHYFEKELVISSEWPNQDGGNTLPTKDISEDLYPFDPASVSSFCKSVFDQHMCDSEDLALVYNVGTENEKTFILNGYAYEYCRFSCGQCTQAADCYTKHNSAMQYLARDPDANSFFVNDFGDFGLDFWGTDDDSNNETEDWGELQNDFFNVEDNSSEQPEEIDTTQESSNFSFDAFSFDTASWNWDFRKRRSVDFVPNPKLGRVVELVRKRRYLNQATTDNYAEQRANIDSIQMCWEKTEEIVEEVVEEFEEAEESDVDQFVDRRNGNDMNGIQDYFAKVTNPDNQKVPMTTPDLEMPCIYLPMPYSEADEDMNLHYSCQLKCPTGQIPMAYNSAKDTLEEAEQFNMQCHRTSKLGWKAPSICMSMSYPNYDLVCQNDIDYVAELEKVAEQVAAESLDESVDDYVADVLNDIYQLYYNFY